MQKTCQIIKSRVSGCFQALKRASFYILCNTTKPFITLNVIMLPLSKIKTPHFAFGTAFAYLLLLYNY